MIVLRARWKFRESYVTMFLVRIDGVGGVRLEILRRAGLLLSFHVRGRRSVLLRHRGNVERFRRLFDQ